MVFHKGLFYLFGSFESKNILSYEVKKVTAYKLDMISHSQCFKQGLSEIEQNNVDELSKFALFYKISASPFSENTIIYNL